MYDGITDPVNKKSVPKRVMMMSINERKLLVSLILYAFSGNS